MKTIIRVVVNLAITLAVLYGTLVYAHGHVTHKCPYAKVAMDHKCGHSANAAKWHPHKMQDEVSVPQDCICPVYCFLWGQGLPVPNGEDED